MEYYDGYDYQGYQDPYAQEQYGYEGYGGYDEYGYDTFQPDGSPPPPPDKDWEDPVLLNRSYLKKIEKDVVLEEYKGLNDLNMFLVEVLVRDFEIKHEVADSEPFKDKSGKEFYTSVKILHYPFLEIGDTKLLRKQSECERVPSYTNLFQTVYTEADPRVSVASDDQTEELDGPGESASESIRDTLKVSIKERQSTAKEEEKEEPEKQTKSYTLEMAKGVQYILAINSQYPEVHLILLDRWFSYTDLFQTATARICLGKNVLFTMTGLAMLQTIMKHEIRVRLSERVMVKVTEADADSSPRTSMEHCSRTSPKPSTESSKQDSPNSSQDSRRKSVVSHEPKTPSLSDDVTISLEGATLGTASVRLSCVYHQAVLEAARPGATPPFHAPKTRTEEYYPLVDSEGEEIGTVGMSIFITCLGRATVNCVRETINEGYEFEHTLFLNKNRFEPPKKSEEAPQVDAKLAKYLLKLGPAIPVCKTSTEILQECLDKNLIQNTNACKSRKSKTDCDWSMMTKRFQSGPVSERTTEETIPDLEPEIGQYLNTRWIELKRICMEMGQKMVEDEWDGPKEKSLYERLEEMRMPVHDSCDVEGEAEMENREEIPQQRMSSLATSRSNTASLKSNSSRKKTI